MLKVDGASHSSAKARDPLAGANFETADAQASLAEPTHPLNVQFAP